jgi:hypothetical protein
MNLEQNGMEVMALDADDHLVRPVLNRLNLSESQLFQVLVDRLRTRRLLMFRAA